MDDILAKIRPHATSSLLNQKTPANLLAAIESTLKEQGTEQTPTAYFAALLTALSGTIQKNDLSLEEGAILPAELYLIARVIPFVPVPVIRTHLDTLLSLSAPLFPALVNDAPSLRSQLSLYHTIFRSLDRSQLETQTIRQAFATILELCVDRRPKVRKVAADTVKDVLEHPPSPLLNHPYASRVAEWVKTILSETAAGPTSKGKAKQTITPGAEVAIHMLAFLRPVIVHLPPSSMPQITNLLLALPRLGNTYLSQSSYSILAHVFDSPMEDDSADLSNQLPDVLKVILTSPPSKSDFALVSSWVLVLGRALSALQSLLPSVASAELHKVWKGVWNFLDSNDQETRRAVATSLSVITSCFSPSLIKAAVSDSGKNSVIRKIIDQVTHALDALQYAKSIPEVLAIAAATMTNLQYRETSSSPTAAEQLAMPLVIKICDLRISISFDHKEAADVFLGTSMRVLGPEVMLKALPLNLEEQKRGTGEEPRAFLLPLLGQPHPSPLSHFVSYFVPLSERMFDYQQKAETEGRQAEAKVWAVLVNQIWGGLSGYCVGTKDLKKSLGPEFSQLLSQLLYTQVELRSSILKAMKVMVEYNVAKSKPDGAGLTRLPYDLTVDEAQENLNFLRSQAESWLSVLFNVYGAANQMSRGMIGDVIAAWLNVAGEVEVHNAFIKCFDLFKTNLRNAAKAPLRQHGNSEEGSITTASQDIIILLLPKLSPSDSQTLFAFNLSADVLSNKDGAIQKRGYKTLSKLLEVGRVNIDAVAIITKLDELSDNLSSAAKKDRFSLLSLLVDFIPSSSLHIIPTLIPEAVLGTKEPSEKARGAAFDLILAMGRKMSGGGVVKRNLVDGMDEDVATDAVANIEEFMTMVAGGLAGASPHMISATVTAISRLVFEFKDTMSQNMLTEILTTLLVFLSSANREIVKSTLGFIKLAIHTLPIDLLQPHLPQLVPALLNWSHDHKNHFKLKVRHIFERILRRFPWDTVYSCAGDMEAAKVLVNIRKSKERAKKKKAAKAMEVDEDEDEKPKATTGDAFEDVLYGSESEEEDDDDVDVPQPPTKAKGNNKRDASQNIRLRRDDDEPLDLLHGAATKLTNQSSKGRRKAGADASRFRVDEGTGKMVIDEEGEEAIDQEAYEIEGNAYKETLTSVDGFTRGPNGRIKFNKDTKKRRREEEQMEDVEMGDAEQVSTAKPKKAKKQEPRLGHEFKAKKAGGDIKKKGMDPYAYLTLSEAAKGKGKKLGIAGKR